LLFCLGRKRLGQTQNALISLINLDQATKLHPPFRHQKRRREKPPLNQKRRREKAPLTSPTTTNNNTEPIVATMIAETMPEPIRMPKCGIDQLPIKAPTMPTAMSPITPNPPPATILRASQPATSPTNRMTKRPCPEMYIAPPQAGEPTGSRVLRDAVARPLWVKSRHSSTYWRCPLYPRKRTFAHGIARPLRTKWTSAERSMKLNEALIGNYAWKPEPSR